MAGELGFFDDLADSLSPWRTADLGCVAVRKVPKDLRNGIPSIGEETGPTSAAARQALALKAQQDAERQLKCKSSLALIQLIQAAIERRETLLAQMGESIGTPVDAARALAQMSIGRLALEDYTDQALAREELAPVDLAAARVDMSELLPRKAYDPGYAHATAAHAQRSAASMGSFLGMRPTGSANGDSYSYYGYDDAPEGYGSYGYYDAAQKPESDGYEYYTDEEARAAATAAELNTMSAASVTAMALSAGKPEAAARKQGSGGGDLYEYDYYDDTAAADKGSGAAAAMGVGSAALAQGSGSATAPAATAPLGKSTLAAVQPQAVSASAVQGCSAANAGVASASTPIAGAAMAPKPEDDEYEYYSDEDGVPASAAMAAATAAATVVAADASYEYYEPEVATDPSRALWNTWAEERARHIKTQRGEYQKRHTANLASTKANEVAEEHDECVPPPPCAASHRCCPDHAANQPCLMRAIYHLCAEHLPASAFSRSRRAHGPHSPFSTHFTRLGQPSHVGRSPPTALASSSCSRPMGCACFGRRCLARPTSRDLAPRRTASFAQQTCGPLCTLAPTQLPSRRPMRKRARLTRVSPSIPRLRPSTLPVRSPPPHRWRSVPPACTLTCPRRFSPPLPSFRSDQAGALRLRLAPSRPPAYRSSCIPLAAHRGHEQ